MTFEGEATMTNVEDTVKLLTESESIIIVPGYGLAVAHGQYPLKEMVDVLVKNGKKVRFAIHPVAGRMPGQLNVLLAEAGVPYDIVEEMEGMNQNRSDCGRMHVAMACLVRLGSTSCLFSRPQRSTMTSRTLMSP